MRRFEGTNKAVDLHGSGKHGYKDTTGTPLTGSIVNAETWNGIQEEIVRVCEAWGLTPSSADLNQLMEALGDGDVGIFGDGSDGDLVTSGDVTLTADVFYDDLTISAGDKISTAGFIAHVKGTLTIEATGALENMGGDGLVGEAGGDGGASPGPGTLQNGTIGAAGDTGAGNNATLSASSLGGAGANGGAGGSGAGGTGGAVGAIAAAAGTIRSLPNAASASTSGDNGGGGQVWVKGGGGGGSGSGDGGADEGGGGGGGSGVMVIRARRIVLASGAIIRCNGGAGGNGEVTGNTGGGGGGGGGLTILIYRSIDDQGATITAAGGAGGAGSGTGVNGSVGAAGTVIQLKG